MMIIEEAADLEAIKKRLRLIIGSLKSKAKVSAKLALLDQDYNYSKGF
jgi:hypothetical protein